MRNAALAKASRGRKAAEPDATDNLGYAQRIREGFSFRSSEARCLSFIVRQDSDMRAPVLLLIVISLSGCTRSESPSARLRYDSIRRLYALYYPPGWQTTQEENIANFITPDGKGAITASTFTSPTGEMEPFFTNMRAVFDSYELVSPYSDFVGASCRGRTAEYRETRDAKSTRWIVRGVHSESVFVLVTVNHPESDFEAMRPLYFSIIDSIEVKDLESGEPGATDNPDGAQRLREDR